MINDATVNKADQIRIRLEKSLLSAIKNEAKKYGLSLSNYINSVLKSSLKKQKISFKEEVGKPEKKEIESRVFFTINEAELLKQHALKNDWSLPKEIRYRIISTLSKKPKLTKEELKAMYSVRFSINMLGANLNQLVRDNQVLSEDNISICSELLLLIRELKEKINYLEQCTYSNFKLQEKSQKK